MNLFALEWTLNAITNQFGRHDKIAYFKFSMFVTLYQISRYYCYTSANINVVSSSKLVVWFF